MQIRVARRVSEPYNEARLEKFRASPAAEARLLVLIDAFSRSGKQPRTLEGRVKLAKLDFFLRYPKNFARALKLRNVADAVVNEVLDIEDTAPIDNRMMRYRYGPWDPSYYAILGSLIGRGLIASIPLPGSGGFGYRTTEKGGDLAQTLTADQSFSEIADRAKLLRRHLDLAGSTLKNLVYQLPEVANATWREEL
jgi:hypothetical protein